MSNFINSTSQHLRWWYLWSKYKHKWAAPAHVHHDHGPARTGKTVRYRMLSFLAVPMEKVDADHFTHLHYQGTPVDHGNPTKEYTGKQIFVGFWPFWGNYQMIGNYHLPIREDQAYAAMLKMASARAGYYSDGPRKNLALGEPFVLDVKYKSNGDGRDIKGEKHKAYHKAVKALGKAQAEWINAMSGLPLTQLVMGNISRQEAYSAFEQYLVARGIPCAPQVAFEATGARKDGWLWNKALVDIGTAVIILPATHAEEAFTTLCTEAQFNGRSGWSLEVKPFGDETDELKATVRVQPTYTLATRADGREVRYLQLQ